MSESVDPLDLLKSAEDLLEKGNSTQASVLCRNALEAALKKISLIKCPDLNLKRLKGPLQINNELKSRNIYSEYWFQEIRNLIKYFGHPSVHAELKQNIPIAHQVVTSSTIHRPWTFLIDQDQSLSASKV